MRCRAFTMVELMAVVSIISMVMGLLVPALATSMRSGQSKKDMTQLRGIQQVMSVFASESDGEYPVPGDLQRKRVQGRFIVGVGERQYQLNFTAAIAGCLIGMRYIDPSPWVSPMENSPLIGIKGIIAEPGGQAVAYDYTTYRPHHGTWFDREFQTRLGDDRPDHCSFANLSLVGPARRSRWHDTSGVGTMCWSTRMTPNGDPAHPDYLSNPVLLQHGPPGQWWGNGACADGSTHVLRSFHPEFSLYETQWIGEPGYRRDNIGDAEFTTGTPRDPEACRQGDLWMTYSCLASFHDTQVLATFDPVEE